LAGADVISIRRRSLRATRRVRLASVLLLVGLAACSSTRPMVKTQSFGPMPAGGYPFARIAVMPFYPDPRLAQDPGASDRDPLAEDWAIAARVARDLSMALVARGAQVTPPSEMELSFQGEGVPTPRLDAKAAAKLASRNFRVDAVLLGTVTRWRDRSGDRVGSERPASVAFRVTLHAAPGGERLWDATFDETQPSLSANPFRVSRYPGRGTRWLSAGELARFGANEVAESLMGPPVE
jgi:hypothetical protein